MRPNLLSRTLQIVFIFCLLSLAKVGAQVLNKPEPADNPNLPGNSAWTAACASSDFNEYFVDFTWTIPLVNPDNEFILELSDQNGAFGSTTELARTSDHNTDFEFQFQFEVPTDVRGENYRFRVRSTSPAQTSPPSDAYSMYYIEYNSPLLISQDGNGTIPPGGTLLLCDGNSITLRPHNISNPSTYQYNWYRSGTPLSERSDELTVSSAGMYYVEVDYGSICSGSANTLSNTIEITTGTSQGIAVDPPSKTVLCPGDVITLQANITGFGYNYTWFKDGVAITGSVINGDSYVIDAAVTGFEGDYQVEISGSGICIERSAALTISNADSFEVTRVNEADIVLLPTQTKTLSVSTTANTPLYQWYKNGAPISGATSNTLDITETGVYFARVTENGGSCPSTSIDSENTNVFSPDTFELVIEYTTSYTPCNVPDITLGLSQINAVASGGSKTDVTSDISSSFSYQWEKDGTAITGETASTIIIADNTSNGDYRLTGTLDTFSPNSNTLTVQLRSNQNVEIFSNGTVFCDSSNPIVITTSSDLGGATFEWQRDGINLGGTSENLSITESGRYALVVTIDGCPIQSNEILINDFDDSLLVLDSDQNIVFPEGESATVTASGAQSYQWYDSSNNLISNSNSATLTNEGEYLVVASFGDCEVSRIITVAYQDIFRVPNVITANGDGINDLWVLPNTYSRRPEVNVIVYNEKGEEILNEANYQNNWPQSTTAFTKQNMVFYYKIRRESKIVKQGTITVIR
ncbi:MAG: gliding motility-associated C-terminal domain-containing protein [Bacteroidota bacterium]